MHRHPLSRFTPAAAPGSLTPQAAVVAIMLTSFGGDGCGGRNAADPISDAGVNKSAQSVTSVPCAPSDDCELFDAGWSLHRSANNAPYPMAAGDMLTLTPDDRYNASAAAWLSREIAPPFSVEFDYSVWDNDGSNNGIWNSADGPVLMFLKDAAPYGVPPTGSTRGFVQDGTGYGLHFDIYGSRNLYLANGSGTMLTRAYDSRVYSDGAWRHIQVDVSRESVTVFFDGTQALLWRGSIATTFRRLGFAAATGAADGEHRIRRVRIATGAGSGSGIPSDQHVDLVYADSLAADWFLGSWRCSGGTIEFNAADATTTAATGGRSIAASWHCPTGWGAFGFDRRTAYWNRLRWMYPNQYRTLAFAFNPGPDPTRVRNLWVTLDNGSNGVLLTDHTAPLEADTWQPVVIPLTDLNSRNERFYRVYFWNGGAQVHDLTVHFDDIALGWVDDSRPPSITLLQATSAEPDRITLAWQTDEHALCAVRYGVDGASTPPLAVDAENEATRTHAAQLEGLAASTPYAIIVMCNDQQIDVDALPNTATATLTVTTPPSDLTAPIITAAAATAIRSSRATVCWNTDEPAAAALALTPTSIAAAAASAVRTSLATEHCLTITGLMPETSYDAELVATDRFGNASRVTSLTITTLAAPASTLQANPDVAVRPFRAGMRGVNIGNWTLFYNRPYPNDAPKLRELTRLVRPGVIRYAGGLLSNSVRWDPGNTQCYPSQWRDGAWCTRRFHDPPLDAAATCGPSTTSAAAYRASYQADEIDNLAAFAQYVGAEVMIEVNIVTCDPQMWAEMLHYTNVEKGYGFKYWELGNELDLVHVFGGGSMAPTDPRIAFGDEYVHRYKRYYNALKSVDASVHVVGPATAEHDDETFFGAYNDFIRPLTEDPQVQADRMLDALSYHYYPLWNRREHTVTVDEMFDLGIPSYGRSRAHAQSCVDNKRRLLDAAGLNNAEIAITEFNAIVAATATPLNYTHAGALYMADMLGRLAYAGADMVMHWELYDYPQSTSFGLISHNHSQIAVDSGTGAWSLTDNFAPMPVYYAYLLYAQFFGDEMLEASSSRPSTLSIWASRDAAQPTRIKLMITNLDDEDSDVTVALGGHVITQANAFHMTNAAFVAAADKTQILGGTSINGLHLDTTSAASIAQSFDAIAASGRPVDIIDRAELNATVGAYSVAAIIVEIE